MGEKQARSALEGVECAHCNRIYFFADKRELNMFDSRAGGLCSS